MRTLLFFGLLFSGAALADLYRWVDPETGSVKFSNFPPASAVGSVERVPFLPQAAPRGAAETAKPAPQVPVLTEAQREELRRAVEALPKPAPGGQK